METTKSSDEIPSYGYSLAIIVVISAFSGVTWYICLSLFVRIFITFKKYKSVYFWALVVASVSTFVQPTCFLLKDFHISNINLTEAFATISWYGMVTGQSVVLYSRLHLVVVDRRKIRWVLCMIIFNFFVLHIPTTFLTYCSHQPKLAPRYDPIYAIYEKIQLTGFFMQEIIISGLYIWEVRKILKMNKYLHKNGSQSVMQHLLCINIFIVLLNVTLLSTEFANLYNVQTVFKTAVYSIKLDLEFSILNRLRLVVTSQSTINSNGLPDMSQPTSPYTTVITRTTHQHTTSETNLSTTDLVERNATLTTPIPHMGIVKRTEIEIDHSKRKDMYDV